MKISFEALEDINVIAAKERELHKQADQWWEVNVTPLLDQCKTRDEAMDVLRQIQIVDGEGLIKDLPGTLSVTKCFIYDRFR